jgi:hypothetical protein
MMELRSKMQLQRKKEIKEIKKRKKRQERKV